MEETNSSASSGPGKNTPLLKITAGLLRYVLGLAMIVSGPLTLLARGEDPMIMSHAIVHPMLTLFVTPQIIIGFYFMFTGKWRLRIDFTLLLVAVAVIYVFSTFSFNA